MTRIIADIEAGKTPAAVRELYVFGSYARGALDCKDLDLVVVHEEPPSELMEELKKKAEAGNGYICPMPRLRFRFKTSMDYSLLSLPTLVPVS